MPVRTPASPIRPRPAALPLAVALLLSTACGGAGDDDRAGAEAGVRTTVDSTGGVVRVTNTGTPPAWRLDSVLAVGDAGGEEFGLVTGVVGDWAGNVYVADAIAKRVYRIGPAGELKATIGREGSGPDELRDVKGLAWVGGKLAVLDAGNGRIPLLSPDGKPSGEFVRWMALTGDVNLEQTAPGEAYAMTLRPGAEGRPPERVYLRLIGPRVTDTLPAPARPTGGGIMCEAQGVITVFSVPQESRFFATRAPGQLSVVGQTGAYRLAFVDARGDTVRVVARELPPPPLSDAEWAETEEEWQKFQERTKGMKCTGSSIARPAAKPAFASLFFDDRGQMWVEAEDTVGYRFDVFDSTGALRGSVPAPPRDRRVNPAIRTGRLFYVAIDSLGVQTVRAAQIVEGDSASAGG